jgi:hypothetical protein
MPAAHGSIMPSVIAPHMARLPASRVHHGSIVSERHSEAKIARNCSSANGPGRDAPSSRSISAIASQAEAVRASGSNSGRPRRSRGPTVAR